MRQIVSEIDGISRTVRRRVSFAISDSSMSRTAADTKHRQCVLRGRPHASPHIPHIFEASLKHSQLS